MNVHWCKHQTHRRRRFGSLGAIFRSLCALPQLSRDLFQELMCAASTHKLMKKALESQNVVDCILDVYTNVHYLLKSTFIFKKNDTEKHSEKHFVGTKVVRFPSNGSPYDLFSNISTSQKWSFQCVAITQST